MLACLIRIRHKQFHHNLQQCRTIVLRQKLRQTIDVSRLTRRSCNTENGLLRNKPFHAVLHVQSDQHHVVILRWWYQVQGLQSCRKGIDTSQNFGVGRINEWRRHPVGADGPKSKARTQGIESVSTTKALVEGAATHVAQFGMASGIAGTANITPVISGAARHDCRPLMKFFLR